MRVLIALLVCTFTFAEDAAPLKVVATTSILRDFARQIGGDRVQATSLIPSGSELHAFQPAPKDATCVANADLVIVNGLGLEQWLDTLIQQSGFAGPVVVAGKSVELLRDASQEPDPHAWLDVTAALTYCENIRAALSAACPAGSADFQARADLYAAQLRALDAWIRRELAPIPPEKRRLVLAHGSLQYFARAYGFEIVAIAGVSDEESPSAARITEIVALVKSGRVSAIFTEHHHGDKLCRQLAADAGIAVGGGLLTDGLAAPGEPGDTYIDMQAVNVRAIARLLR
jgi:zinc/manganese transport system substrate-binding protein